MCSPFHTTTRRRSRYLQLGQSLPKGLNWMRQKFVYSMQSKEICPNPHLDPTKQDGVVCKILSQQGKAYIGKTRRYMKESKGHSRDLQFAHTKTSTEWNTKIRKKGERERGAMDSRAVYTREIICGLYNKRTVRIKSTFIRHLCYVSHGALLNRGF